MHTTRGDYSIRRPTEAYCQPEYHHTTHVACKHGSTRIRSVGRAVLYTCFSAEIRTGWEGGFGNLQNRVIPVSTGSGVIVY